MNKESIEQLESEFVESLNLLKEASSLFRGYEGNHRAKIDKSDISEEAKRDTLTKAERNKEIADRIDAFLTRGMASDVTTSLIAN